tara:strand:- start:5494 stop:5652 length:159 start_codon:yes stop_codon:yes gene_type:complete
MIRLTSLISLLATVLLAHYAYIVPNMMLSMVAGAMAVLMLLGNIVFTIQNKE